VRQCDAHAPLVGEDKQSQQRCQPQPTDTNVVTQLGKRSALAQSSMKAKELRLPPGARRRLHVSGKARYHMSWADYCCGGTSGIAAHNSLPTRRASSVTAPGMAWRLRACRATLSR
jgi:hypothetical protein